MFISCGWLWEICSETRGIWRLPTALLFKNFVTISTTYLKNAEAQVKTQSLDPLFSRSGFVSFVSVNTYFITGKYLSVSC